MKLSVITLSALVALASGACTQTEQLGPENAASTKAKEKQKADSIQAGKDSLAFEPFDCPPCGMG